MSLQNNAGSPAAVPSIADVAAAGAALQRRSGDVTEMLFRSLSPVQNASLAGVDRIQAWCELLGGQGLSVEGIDRRTHWIGRMSLASTRLMGGMHRAAALIDRLEQAADRRVERALARAGRQVPAIESTESAIAPHAKRAAAVSAEGTPATTQPVAHITRLAA